jgi:DNA mismatch endonuclease (patch repair protein)
MRFLRFLRQELRIPYADCLSQDVETMTDVFSKRKRSGIMSLVKSEDTVPEIIVRKIIYGMGFRYGLHSMDLPGKPDIVLRKHKKAVFVNGCFWHGHKGCRRAIQPSSNKKFWKEKIEKNSDRDKRSNAALRKLGFSVLTVWGCQIKNEAALKRKLSKFLTGERSNECKR